MPRYPKATRLALRRAWAKSNKKPTTAQRVLRVLDKLAGPDGWVSARELHIKTTHKAASRLSELRRFAGVEYERHRDPESPKGENWQQYRLVRR